MAMDFIVYYLGKEIKEEETDDVRNMYGVDES